MKRILSLVTLIAITFTISKAQHFESKVDSLLTHIFQDKTGSGGVFMVSKNGKSIYKKAFGHANQLMICLSGKMP